MRPGRVKTVAGRELLHKKSLIRRLWDSAIKFALWVVDSLKDKTNLIIFVAVVAVMYSPCWLSFLMYCLTDSSVFLAITTGYLAFWAGPFTPFFPLCIAITLGVRRLLRRMVRRRQKRQNRNK